MPLMEDLDPRTVAVMENSLQKISTLKDLMSVSSDPTASDCKKLLGLKSALLTQIGLSLLSANGARPKIKISETRLAISLLNASASMDAKVADIELTEKKLEIMEEELRARPQARPIKKKKRLGY